MHPRLQKTLIYLVPTVMALMIIPVLAVTRHHRRHEARPLQADTLRCIIALQDDPARSSLAAGFNYALLKKYCEDSRTPAEIDLGARSADWPDSLRRGRVDLVILENADTLDARALMRSRTYDGAIVWLMRAQDRQRIKGINTWISDIVGSAYYANARKAFFRRQGDLSTISPYDDMIKKYAARIGWDWRLVAALIYHESRFSMGAESHKGAVGLMQVMPITYSMETLLDPETNIYLGTRHLRSLERQFSGVGADTTENLKFVLAAYNGGAGRIQRYIEYAAEQKADATRWESVYAAARTMEGFNGAGIDTYVSAILSTYYDYSRLYPR